MQLVWVRKPKALPVVLTHDEVLQLINNLKGIYKLIAQLLYGSGLRLMECLRLRIKDIDFQLNQIVVRSGKGEKDRVTMLPKKLTASLKIQIEKAKLQHKQDLEDDTSSFLLPNLRTLCVSALKKPSPNTKKHRKGTPKPVRRFQKRLTVLPQCESRIKKIKEFHVIRVIRGPHLSKKHQNTEHRLTNKE